jgi:hypothetical protein
MDSADQDSGSAVKLAIAILLFWLAGMCFYVAFEGQKFLAEGLTAPDYWSSILQGIAQKAQTQEGTS